jgi:DinB family protein
VEITYTPPTDPSFLDPVKLSEQLAAVVRSAVPWLVTLSNAEASLPEREGKWSTKEIIGHLTDSAVNNLGRIIRLQITPEAMPGYAQDAWVNLQHYQQREWSEVLGLWFALNEHLVWIIRHIPQPTLALPGVVAGGPITLGYLIEDYIAHMEHHFRALRQWVPQPSEASS